MTLEGKHIMLRALEPEDLEFLYQLENDEKVWEVSHTLTPYSKFVLKKYLAASHRDIYEVKQLRLVICEQEKKRPVGFVDFFDFDPKNQKIGLGIVIFQKDDRGRGYASEAIQQCCRYAFQHLNVHQVYANISEDNTSSIGLFEKLGFQFSGEKKDWIFSEGIFKNELLYQLFNEQ